MLSIVIILSVVQGLSEFLPISSSAHLLLIPWLFHWSDPGLGFDAAIHLGTAVALIVYFWKDLWRIVLEHGKLFWYLVIASIPGAIFGFFGDKWIEEHLHQASSAPLIVGVSLIVMSFVLYWIDRRARLKRDIADMKQSDALWIGAAQALALVPGVSRSGATIAAGELIGLTREEAARFSFLLAVPITVGAGAYKTLQLLGSKGQGVSHTEVVVGVVVSAIVGWLVIKWLLNYLQRHTLTLFVVYRIILGLLVVGVWLMRR